MSSGIIGEAVREEVKEIVEEVLESKFEEFNKLSQAELKEIVDSLIPDINDLISNQVNKHFIEIAQYALEKFKGELD